MAIGHEDENLGGPEPSVVPPPTPTPTAPAAKSASVGPVATQSITTGSPINPLFNDSRGPLSALEGSDLSYKSLRYPLDVETNARYGYYVSFNILMAVRSQYYEKLAFGDQQADTITQREELLKQREKDFQTVGTGVHTTNGSGTITKDESGKVTTNALATPFKRQVIKTNQTISLYMPDTLIMEMEQKWDQTDISGTNFGKAGQALSTMSTAYNWIKKAATGEEASFLESLNQGLAGKPAAVLGEAVGKAIGGGEAGVDLGLSMVGYALNPAFEVLYKSPDRRKFSFEFIFAPRNRKEAETAIAIIQMFKFHSSPETMGGGDLGRYFIPPSEFNIQFLSRNGEAWQLGKVLPQCVLTTINVNYGQSGIFAVLPDGTPTNIQMRLEFQETEFLTKKRIEEGY